MKGFDRIETRTGRKARFFVMRGGGGEAKLIEKQFFDFEKVDQTPTRSRLRRFLPLGSASTAETSTRRIRGLLRMTKSAQGGRKKIASVRRRQKRQSRFWENRNLIPHSLAPFPHSPKGKARLACGEREMIIYPFGNFFFMILQGKSFWREHERTFFSKKVLS